MTDEAPTQKEVYEAYSDLHESLRDAYWSTEDEKAGDKITALADACYSILIKLNQDDIKSRSAEFKQVQNLAKATNARLKAVSAEITKIIHNVEVAAKVVGNIEKALKFAARFLA